MKKLTVWVGPTGSEKTTKAMLLVHRYHKRKLDIVAARPAKARRKHEPEGWIVSKGKYDLRWPCFEINHPFEIIEAARGAQVFWLDEPVHLESKEKDITGDDVFNAIMEVRKHALILISGCAATSELEVFGDCTSKLISVADMVHWCFADCEGCGRMNAGSRSWYKLGPKTEQVAIGGEEAYEPLCWRCWNRRMEERVLEQATTSA